MAQNYGRSDYWEDRYQKDRDHFDFLQRYIPPMGATPLRDIISKYLNQDSQILLVGCGTSMMAEELVDEGFLNVTGSDMSYYSTKFMND